MWFEYFIIYTDQYLLQAIRWISISNEIYGKFRVLVIFRRDLSVNDFQLLALLN